MNARTRSFCTTGAPLLVLALVVLALLGACQGPPALKIGGKCDSGLPLCLSDAQCVREFGVGSYCDANNCCVSSADGDPDFDFDIQPDGDYDGYDGYDSDLWDDDSDNPNLIHLTDFSASPTDNVLVGTSVFLRAAAQGPEGQPIYYRFLATPPYSQAPQLVQDFNRANSALFVPRSAGLWTLTVEVKGDPSGTVQDSRQILLTVYPTQVDGDTDTLPEQAHLIRAWFEPDSPQPAKTLVTFYALAVSPNGPLYMFKFYAPDGKVLSYGEYTEQDFMAIGGDTPGDYRFEVSVRDRYSTGGAEDTLSMIFTFLPTIDGDFEPDHDSDTDHDTEVDFDSNANCGTVCTHALACQLIYSGSIFGATENQCRQRCSRGNFSEEQLICATYANCSSITECLYPTDGDTDIDSIDYDNDYDTDYDTGVSCNSACTNANNCGQLYPGSLLGSNYDQCVSNCLAYGLSFDQLMCATYASCDHISDCLFATDGDVDTDSTTSRILSFSCVGALNGVLNLGQTVTCTLYTDPLPPQTRISYAYQLGGGQWTSLGSASTQTLTFKPDRIGSYKLRARVVNVNSGAIYDDQSTYAFQVTQQTQILDFACYPQDRAYLGQTVNCKVSVQDPSATQIRFDYGLGTTPSSWVMVQDFAFDAAVNYYLQRASSYTLRVRTRSVNSSADFDEQRSLVYTMLSPVDGDTDAETDFDIDTGLSRIESFSCVPRSPAYLGQPLTCTATTTPPVGQTLVSFDYGIGSSPTAWVTLQDFYASSSVSFVPPSVNLYTIRARSRNVISSQSYDDMAVVMYSVVTTTDGDVDVDPETDIPICDDNNTCTKDSYDSTVARCIYSALPDGTPCPLSSSSAAGVCASGTCVNQLCPTACEALNSCGYLGTVYPVGNDYLSCLNICAQSSNTTIYACASMTPCPDMPVKCFGVIIDGDLDTDTEHDNDTEGDTESDADSDTAQPDTDHDGIFDYLDNCPYVYNPDQTDRDGDGVGDACDPTPYTPNACAVVSCQSDPKVCADFGLTCGSSNTCTKACTTNADCPNPFSCQLGQCGCPKLLPSCPLACSTNSQCPSSLPICADAYGADGVKECTSSCKQDADCASGYRCGTNNTCICDSYPDTCSTTYCATSAECTSQGFDTCLGDSTGKGVCSSLCTLSSDCPNGTTCQSGECKCPEATATCQTGNCLFDSNCSSFGAGSFCTGDWWPIGSRYCTLNCTSTLDCIAAFGAASTCNDQGQCACAN